MGTVLAIGGAAQLLVVLTIALIAQGQYHVSRRKNLYLHVSRQGTILWRIYAGLAVAYACFIAYAAIWDGRNPIVICVVVISTVVGCGYAAVNCYKTGDVCRAVAQCGIGLSSFGYAGALIGPYWTRMVAASLMFVGLIVAALAVWVPMPGEEESKDSVDARRV
jgi:hypothetical protein